MAITVQQCLDQIISLIARDEGEDPTDDQILFWMDAALKELQSDANWPVLRVVAEVAVSENDTTVVLGTNVIKKVNAISYIYNDRRVVMSPSAPSQWGTVGTYPTRFTVSSPFSILVDVPFPSSGNIVCDSYQFLPLPTVLDSNSLIDIAPQLITAKTMMLLAPLIRMEPDMYRMYGEQVNRAVSSLNRWTASLVGAR